MYHTTVKLFTVSLLLLFSMGVFSLNAQITAGQEAQARQELKRRNIDEGALKKRLLDRGIDVDNLDAAELAAVQDQIEQVVAEMELEASRTAISRDTASPATSSVQQEIAEPAPRPAEITEPPSDLPPSDIWGHNVFRNKSLQVYGTNDNVQAPPSYRLSSGDIIAVNIFGASQEDLKLTVDPEGFINPPGMPRIQVKGLRLDEARALAQSRFSRYYIFKQGQFSFNVDVTRTITINIYGETETNGSFTLSAVNTVFNALVAAGGPTDRGSVRAIKVISDGEDTVVDLYEFLTDPNRTANLYLEDNDIIFVPPAKEVVSIGGAVNRAGRFELLPGETLADLIFYADGTTNQAITSGITITRTEGNQQKVIDAGYLAAAAIPDLRLIDNDEILVPQSRVTNRNFVEVVGAVTIPGYFAFQEGMRVKDLLDKGGIRPDTRLDAGFLRRINDDSTATVYPINLGSALELDPADNLVLSSGDQLILFSKAAFAEQAYFSVSGAVKSDITNFPFSADGKLRVEDALILADGLQPNASEEAFLIRTNPANRQERQYIRLNLSEQSSRDQLIRPFDSLVVYSNERFSDPFPVAIRGAVRLPGDYTYDPSLGLKELFTLAGGLKLEAARNRIDVFRLQFGVDETTRTVSTSLEIDENYNITGGPVGDFTLRPYDVVVVRSVPEFELIQTVSIQGEVRFPGDYALDSDNLNLTDLIEKAGGLTTEAFPPGATLNRSEDNTGFVVIRLDAAIENDKSVDNIKLRDGDEVFIPKTQELVAIVPQATRANQVYERSLIEDGTLDVAFSGKRSAKWYIDNYAGGFEQTAKRSSLTVQYVNGELGRTKKLLWFNIYPKVRPGSTIRVANKEVKPERERREEPVDWVAVTQASLGAITTFLTLYLLIDRTNQ